MLVKCAANPQNGKDWRDRSACQRKGIIARPSYVGADAPSVQVRNMPGTKLSPRTGRPDYVVRVQRRKGGQAWEV